MDHLRIGPINRWTPSFPDEDDNDFPSSKDQNHHQVRIPLQDAIIKKAKLWWYRFEVFGPLYVMDHEERLFFLIFMGIVVMLSLWAFSTLVSHTWRYLMSLLGAKDAWNVVLTPKTGQRVGMEIIQVADQIYGSEISGQVIANSSWTGPTTG